MYILSAVVAEKFGVHERSAALARGGSVPKLQRILGIASINIRCPLLAKLSLVRYPARLS